MVEQVVDPERQAAATSGRSSEDAARDGALADLELNLLLEAILRFSGLDFRDYSQSTLKRRVSERLRDEKVQTISGLQERILHDPAAFARFVFAMSGGPGHLFREPGFFGLLRSKIVPLLRTYSFSRIWVPNCSRGEDAYSLAAVLHEEDLLSRTMIYATDASEIAVAAAKRGIFEFETADAIKASHRATGATKALSETAEIGEHALVVREELRKNLIFAQHSLISDKSINEFHLIVARGVLTQFNKALQFRVHNLFINSLIRLGFLALGPNETIKGTPHERIFREVSEDEPIYRRMR
jgi:chemotaxis protein methyltransferase CheR